jgi:hypothetical protein
VWFLVAGTVVLCLAFAFFGFGQASLQSLYLRNARVVGRLTWGDVVLASQTVAKREEGANITQIGRRSEDGKRRLVVLTDSHTVYQFEEAGLWHWKLVQTGNYVH